MPRFEIKTEHTFHNSHADAAQIWQALTDFPNYPRWNHFILNIVGLPKVGNKIAFTFQLPRGVILPAKAEIQVVNPNIELRWKGHFIMDALFSAEHYFILQHHASGTRMLHGEIFRGLLLPFLRPMLKIKGTPVYRQMNLDLESYLSTRSADMESL